VIVDLGGEPTTVPMDFDEPSTLAEMLRLDLEVERADVERYVRHAELAEELGELEIKVELEEIAADEGRHGRELERLLRRLS
jgi:bacterioferritin